MLVHIRASLSKSLKTNFAVKRNQEKYWGNTSGERPNSLSVCLNNNPEGKKMAARSVPFVSHFDFWLSAASRWTFLDAVWHTWFPLRVWLGQVKRPDVTSNPLALPPSESPRNPQRALGFSGYKPSFVCPLQHQAQPWCHGYLKRFNWPTIITHSFKKQPPLEEIFLCCSLGLSTFLPVPEPPNPNRTWSHTAGVFFLTLFSWIYFLSTSWRF